MSDSSDEVVDNVRVEQERSRAGFFGSETAVHAALLIFGAVVIALVFRKLQYSTQSVCCGDFDGYYHIRWSRLLWEGMREGHFPPAFNWLPLTTLNPRDYVDHHLFFHFLQIPFTWFGDLRAGAKMASLVYASLAVFSCYLLIVRYRIRHTLIWLAALLACSAPFLYRLNMAKAPPVAIIFMLVGIYLLFEKRYLPLLPLAFIFVWTYSLFITLFGMAVIWTCVIAWSERRFEWRPLAWTFIGTIAGLVINPYFPKNIRLFIEHVVMKVAPSGFAIEVGQEWYPYDSWYLLGSCAIAFLAMIVGYIAYDSTDRKRAARPLFLLVFSTILMGACFAQRRWVEYWPPFAVLFAAFSLRPLLEGARAAIGRLPSDLMEELQPFLDRHEMPGTVEGERRRDFLKEIETAAVGIALGLAGYFILKQLVYPREVSLVLVAVVVVTALLGFAAYIFWRRSVGRIVGVVVLAFLVIIVNFNVRETRKSIEGDAPPDRYEASMAWIRENVPAGETVFNTDWDDFPKMFYYDTKHAYASGLDPTYLLDRDKQLKREPKLAELYKKITLGQDDDPAPLIRDKFGARYVFSDNEEIHENFYAKAIASGWFDQVHIYVFERKDGRALNATDLSVIKENAPPELNNWTLISNGRRVVSGSIHDFVCGDINGLCVDFFVNKDVDSTVLVMRDQKGPPPAEAQEETGGENDGTDDGGDEEEPPGNQ
jgi:asparagine N-glycosylation enzyme membrane subunit Stt3